MDQNLIIQAAQLQRQHEELSQHLEIVARQIEELETFNKQLNNLKNAKGREILASIGKGVRAKTQILDDKLFVEVGSGVIVKKTPEQTQEVIQEQIKKLIKFKIQLTANLEQYQAVFQQIVQQLEESEKR